MMTRRRLIVATLLFTCLMVSCGLRSDKPTVIELTPEEINQLETLEAEVEARKPVLPVNKPLVQPPKPSADISDKVSIALQKGLSGIHMAYMIEEATMNADDLQMTFSVDNTTTQLIEKFTSNDVQFILIPTHIASGLYKRTDGQVQIIGVNTIDSQYLADYVKGLKNKREFRFLGDFQEETLTETPNLPIWSLVAHKQFLEDHPLLVKTFVKGYVDSTNHTEQNADEVAQLLVDHKLLADLDLASDVIQNGHITWKRADASKETIQAYLNMLYDINTKLVGGQLPDETFYYKFSSEN